MGGEDYNLLRRLGRAELIGVDGDGSDGRDPITRGEELGGSAVGLEMDGGGREENRGGVKGPGPIGSARRGDEPWSES